MADAPVSIQLPLDASPELIARVKAAFPDAALADAAPVAAEAKVAAAEEAVAAAAAAAPRLPDTLAAWWDALPVGGFWIAAWLLGALAAGYAVERAALALIPARPAPDPGRFRPRAVAFGRWLLRRLVGLTLFAVTAFAVGRALAPADAELREFARGVLLAVVRARAVFALLDALAAPGAPWRRPMGFDEAEAARVRGAVLALTVISLAIAPLRALLDAAVGAAPEGNLARLGLVCLSAAVGLWFFARVAAPVRALLLREASRPGAATPAWTLRLAERWHWVYFGAVLLDVALKALGVLGLLGPMAAGGAGQSLLILALAPLAVAGLRVWRRDDGGARRGGLTLGLFALAEGAVIVLAGLMLIRAWGVDPLAVDRSTGLARILPGVVEAAVTLAAGFALWRAAAALLSAPREAAAEDVEAAGEEGGGKKGTRLDTVLPVLRGFALALIGVTTLFMALSALGVNIAPLLASAGIVGLAIGFGAQRLVADVISGLLYLYEDAFRVGEYIEVSGGKGQVERISLRSVRLRHPRGPVYTIPFSSMGTVQNHSRDWATMKFSFQVPDDTDVEMVRKVVKKVGEEMMGDPALAGKILVPLKSQGAVAISGASFTIGIKFTAVPGEQFAIRRRAFASLQKALREKGIELYRPELTLASADPASPQPAA
jgi:small-conductance mechanosensitive channel